MLDSVKMYVYDRRKGISKTVGAVGCMYLARGYIRERLDEVKVKMEEDRVARESLKQRFAQTQEDASYTVLALLPTLAEQILDEMDVEGLTQELQNRSRSRNSGRQLLGHAQRPPSSLASSIDMLQEQETRSDAGSAAPSAISASQSPAMSTSGLRSWVESSGSPSPAPSLAASSDSFIEDGHPSPSMMSATVSDSVVNVENVSVDGSGLSESIISLSGVSESSESRTKAELWNEVKMLTFTRTLTTLYSTTLLCLLTTVQLTLLSRSKYVQSVYQLERDERIRDLMESELTMTNLLLGGGKNLEDLMSGNLSGLLDGDGAELDVDGITEEVESKYLTMSWWLLHVGWKDVGERVRRGVEEVFDAVSLKTKLAAIDLHRLLSDVRRRVEHEITFEGNERRINFLSTLLPPTPETIQHVLTQGGFPSQPLAEREPYVDSTTSLSSSQISQFSPVLGLSTFHHDHRQYMESPSSPLLIHPHTRDPPFMALVEETRSIISSSDFEHVLEVCLDRATEVLFTGLVKNVFVSSDQAPGEDVRIRLAGLLPGLARWSHLALNGLPNELVDNLLAARETSCLSAIVFSRFEEKFR